MKDYNIKKILVPFDFSHKALNALKVADKMAVEFNAVVDLINVIEPFVSLHPMGFGSGFPIDLGTYAQRSALALEKYLTNNSIYPEAYSYRVELGFLTTVIVNLNKIEPYDLIILPYHENSILNNLYSKHNPLKIMEITGTPVITVSRYHRIVDLKNIILPIRNVTNWFEKIPFMVSLVKRTGGKIHAVGLRESQKDPKTQFNAIFDEAISVLEKENILSSVNKFEGSNSVYKLKLFSDAQKADLIAVTPPIRSRPLLSLFRPSVFNRLAADSTAPVFGVNSIA